MVLPCDPEKSRARSCWPPPSLAQAEVGQGQGPSSRHLSAPGLPLVCLFRLLYNCVKCPGFKCMIQFCKFFSKFTVVEPSPQSSLTIFFSLPKDPSHPCTVTPGSCPCNLRSFSGCFIHTESYGLLFKDIT